MWTKAHEAKKPMVPRLGVSDHSRGEEGQRGIAIAGYSPVRMKNKKLINALYPTYKIPPAKPPKLNFVIQ